MQMCTAVAYLVNGYESPYHLTGGVDGVVQWA